MNKPAALALVALVLCAAAPIAGAADDAAAAPAAATFLKPKKGGVGGNSFASQMVPVNDTTLRVTTRNQFNGNVEEVTKPGTSANRALQAVADSATRRAATEARALGYPAFRVVSFRNLSQVREQRANSRTATGEDNYSFAPGKYDQTVELAIELTVGLVAAPPAPGDKDVYAVAAILDPPPAAPAGAGTP